MWVSQKAGRQRQEVSNERRIFVLFHTQHMLIRVRHPGWLLLIPSPAAIQQPNENIQTSLMRCIVAEIQIADETSSWVCIEDHTCSRRFGSILAPDSMCFVHYPEEGVVWPWFHAPFVTCVHGCPVSECPCSCAQAAQLSPEVDRHIGELWCAPKCCEAVLCCVVDLLSAGFAMTRRDSGGTRCDASPR